MHHVGHPKIKGLPVYRVAPLGHRYSNLLLRPRNGALAGKCSAKCQVVTFTARWWKGYCRVPKNTLPWFAEYVCQHLTKSKLGHWSHTRTVLIFQINIHILHLGIRPPQKSNITDVFRQEYLSTGKLQGVRRLRKEWAQGHKNTSHSSLSKGGSCLDQWNIPNFQVPAGIAYFLFLLNHFRPMNFWRPLRFLQDSAWHQLGIAGPPSLRLRSPSDARQKLFPSGDG